MGGAPPAAGTFAVQVENHTVYYGHVLLARIAPGVSRAKVASFLTSVSPGVPLAFYGVTLPER